MSHLFPETPLESARKRNWQRAQLLSCKCQLRSISLDTGCNIEAEIEQIYKALDAVVVALGEAERAKMYAARGEGPRLHGKRRKASGTKQSGS